MPTPDQLLALTKANTSFSREIPGLQIAWDSTSLGMLKTCPRKYYLAMIEGWEPKGKAIALDFGIWYHQGLEQYHKFRAEPCTHDEALRRVVAFLLVESGSRDETTGVLGIRRHQAQPLHPNPSCRMVSRGIR